MKFLIVFIALIAGACGSDYGNSKLEKVSKNDFAIDKIFPKDNSKNSDTRYNSRTFRGQAKTLPKAKNRAVENANNSCSRRRAVRISPWKTLLKAGWWMASAKFRC